MRLVPEDISGKIQFYQSKIAPWLDNAGEIGTTPEMVASLADATQEARDAALAQAQAQSAAQAATNRLRMAIDRMTSVGAQIVMQIRTQAAQSGNSVYALAKIPAPAQGAPIAAPGTPANFTVELQNCGWVTIQWKCKNPRGAVGTMYQVRRRIDGGASEFLGTVGEKKFVDQSIPMGSKAIIYEVTGVRSTTVGRMAQYNVTFGSMRNGVSTVPISTTVRGRFARAA